MFLFHKEQWLQNYKMQRTSTALLLIEMYLLTKFFVDTSSTSSEMSQEKVLKCKR